MCIDADKVARLCFDFYKKNIPLKIRPSQNEWTTLAAIVLLTNETNENDPKLKVLCMATGSKCLAEKELPLDGSLIHDSHAEILVRRCFKRYLYNEMFSLRENKNYISETIQFENNQHKFYVKPGVEFALFISHTPCGDASIIPKNSQKRNAEEELSSDVLKKLKPEVTSNQNLNETLSSSSLSSSSTLNNKQHTIEDIYRTGAKCVPNSSIQDSKEKGVNYHSVEALRTKPGRGNPTISMSCSDKIAKWLILGIQGSLLSSFLTKPIYLKAIVISKCPFDYNSMQRALIERSGKISNLPNDYLLTKPNIIQSSLIFEHSKTAKNNDSTNENDEKEDENLRASHTSLCWISNVKTKQLFVLVKGNLQGSVKNSKKSTNKTSQTKLLICKRSFLESFKKLYENNSNESDKLNSEFMITPNYLNAKKNSTDYNKGLDAFYSFYKEWIRTDPEKYYKFSV